MFEKTYFAKEVEQKWKNHKTVNGKTKQDRGGKSSHYKNCFNAHHHKCRGDQTEYSIGRE